MRPLFNDARDRTIAQLGAAGFFLHAMVAGRVPAAKEELCQDAFALAGEFMKQADKVFEEEMQKELDKQNARAEAYQHG